MTTRHYVAIIEAGDLPGYSVFFPDLDGCTSAGDTVQAAAINAGVALGAHVALMAQDGDPIPEASAPDAIPADPEVREVARLLLPVELPGRAIRVNVTVEEGLLDAIDRTARARGMSRSGFLADAARRALAPA